MTVLDNPTTLDAGVPLSSIRRTGIYLARTPSDAPEVGNWYLFVLNTVVNGERETFQIIWAVSDGTEYYRVSTGGTNYGDWALRGGGEGGGPVPASLVSFNNITSGLDATNVQSAIDEIVAGVIAGISSDLGTLTTRVDGAEEDIDELQTDYGALDTRVTNTEGDITALDARLDPVETKLATIETGADVNLTPEELVEAIDTELGSEDWRTGGGGGATNLSVTNRTATTIDIASSTGTDATLPSADLSEAGIMSVAAFTKLDGIEEGAEVNPDGAEIVTLINDALGGEDWQDGGAAVGTDIDVINEDADSIEIVSSTGNGVVVTGATETEAGIMTAADKVKLNGMTAGAEPNDPNTVLDYASSNFTAGYTATAYDNGNAPAELDLDVENGNYQIVTNDGAFDLNAPANLNDYSITLKIINSASAGTITPVGFHQINGVPFDSIEGSHFICHILRLDGTQMLTVVKIGDTSIASAEEVTYDNVSSGSESENVQEALDELFDLTSGGGTGNLRDDETANLTAGFTATAYNLGTMTTGSLTPDPANGNYQRVINGGAWEIEVPTNVNDFDIVLEITNNGSAGAITFDAAYDLVEGNIFNTTNTEVFQVQIRKLNGFISAAIKNVTSPTEGGVPTEATDIDYDNGTSGLAATNVQDAIDEIVAEGATGNLSADESANLTAGFSATAYNLGTMTTGTLTLDVADGNYQRVINGGGPWDIALPSDVNDYDIVLQITNNGSAGDVTFDVDYDLVEGNPFNTDDAEVFQVQVRKINGFISAAVKNVTNPTVGDGAMTDEEIVAAINAELGSTDWQTGGASNNLGVGNRTATTLDITSSTGTDATVPAANTDEAGLMTATQFDKLAGIEAGAQVNPTDSAIVAAINAELGSTDWQNNDPGSPATNATARVATTGPITIATGLNSGDVIDGITLANDDIVLVKDQASPAQNGLITVGPSPARTVGYTTMASLAGLIVSVQEGTTNEDTIWLCTADPGDTIDVDPVTFEMTALVPTNLSMDRDTVQVEILSSTGTGTAIPAATTSLAGVMTSTDKTKLDGIEEGAEVNLTGSALVDSIDAATGSDEWRDVGSGSTNLSVNRTTSGFTIVSDTGNDAVVGGATSTDAGAMTTTQVIKLAGIETGANNYVHPNHTGHVTSTADGATVIAAGVVEPSMMTSDAREFSLVVHISGNGDVIPAGIIEGDYTAAFPFEITNWIMLGDTTGSAVIDVWVDTYANYPPTNDDSITSSAPPTVTTNVKATAATSGWSDTTIAAGDIIRFNVDSASGFESLTLVLSCRKT